MLLLLSFCAEYPGSLKKLCYCETSTITYGAPYESLSGVLVKGTIVIAACHLKTACTGLVIYEISRNIKARDSDLN
jgi:hypothetical protein